MAAVREEAKARRLLLTVDDLAALSIVHMADVDISVIAQRRDFQARLYYVLRAADDRGTGMIMPDQVREAAAHLGLSKRALRRVVTAGQGIFWEAPGDGRVFLRAVDHVATALGVRFVRAAYRAPLSDLRGPLRVVRARMALQAVAAVRKGLPTSNYSLARMLAVSIRTIRVWRGLSGLRSIPNFCLVAPLTSRENATAISRATRQPGLRAVRFRGQVWLARELPRSFPVTRLRGVRSRLQQTNRRLRSRSAERAPFDHRDKGNATQVLYRRPGGPQAPPTPRSPARYTHVETTAGKHRVAIWEPVLPEEMGGTF